MLRAPKGCHRVLVKIFLFIRAELEEDWQSQHFWSTVLENASRARFVHIWGKSQYFRHRLVAQLKVNLLLIDLVRLMSLLVEVGPREDNAIRLVVEDVGQLLLLKLDDAVLEEEFGLLEDD